MFSWKQKQFLLLMKRHAVTLQILFLRGISWRWRAEKTFSSLIFWKNSTVNEFMGLLIFPFKKGGQSFQSSAVWKAEVVTHGNLYVNKHATCYFKISSPVTVSLFFFSVRERALFYKSCDLIGSESGQYSPHPARSQRTVLFATIC